MSRPRKLTQETAEKILRGVRSGMPLELAAPLAGVRRSTVLEWVRRGEARDRRRGEDVMLSRFADQYRQAQAQFAQLCVSICVEALTGKRRSKKGGLVRSGKGIAGRALEAKWHLARRFPAFWGAAREQIVVDVEATPAAAPGQGAGFRINVIVSGDEPTPLEETR